VISKQEMKNRARDLRKESTIAELNLWYTLRNRGLKGYKFHRQFVMGSYIVDFVCWEKKLVIEIDGGQHVQNIKYDENRTAYLNERGFRVLRYWNDEVLNKTEYVLENILEALESIA
jgi:very-short-patch-repair endonuclease